MKHFLFTVLIFPATLCAQDNTSLPVKRVVLYKNGVGYFEHVGQVRDKQDVTIQFTSGQLNDVLKSLTVLDLDGARITGVAYGSSAPMEPRNAAQRLRGSLSPDAAPSGCSRVFLFSSSASRRLCGGLPLTARS
jgi:hypothetical protein